MVYNYSLSFTSRTKDATLVLEIKEGSKDSIVVSWKLWSIMCGICPDCNVDKQSQ
jgi:hypothetical protein